jgi:hypothetical protein
MASKTFIPALVVILKKACVYIARYQHTLEHHLPTGGAAALNGIVLACDVFMALVPDNTAP